MHNELIAIGGWHAVTAVLSSTRPVTEVLLRGGREDARSKDVTALAQARGVPVRAVDEAEIEKLLPGVNHQGCAVLAAPVQTLDESGLYDLLETTASPFLLVLDQVQDPHNLGACLRSAAAAGVDAVIVPKDRSAPLGPAASKVAAGGAELVPLVRVTNLTRCLKTLQKSGVWVVGTAMDAPHSIYAADLKGSLALVLGGEAGGLRRLTTETCDVLAFIPMSSGVESLNVSVAAGVCLFEAVRQRQA